MDCYFGIERETKRKTNLKLSHFHIECLLSRLYKSYETDLVNWMSLNQYSE